MNNQNICVFSCLISYVFMMLQALRSIHSSVNKLRLHPSLNYQLHDKKDIFQIFRKTFFKLSFGIPLFLFTIFYMRKIWENYNIIMFSNSIISTNYQYQTGSQYQMMGHHEGSLSNISQMEELQSNEIRMLDKERIKSINLKRPRDQHQSSQKKRREKSLRGAVSKHKQNTKIQSVACKRTSRKSHKKLERQTQSPKKSRKEEKNQSRIEMIQKRFGKFEQQVKERFKTQKEELKQMLQTEKEQRIKTFKILQQQQQQKVRYETSAYRYQPMPMNTMPEPVQRWQHMQQHPTMIPQHQPMPMGRMNMPYNPMSIMPKFVPQGPPPQSVMYKNPMMPVNPLMYQQQPGMHQQQPPGTQPPYDPYMYQQRQ